MPNKAVESHGRRANAIVPNPVCSGAAQIPVNGGMNLFTHERATAFGRLTASWIGV